MPAIEIICIDQKAPLDVARYPFAIDISPKPVSPRCPQPLFAEDLAALNGFRYHLGNPFFKNPQTDGAFSAQELLSEWCQSQLESLEFDETVAQSIYEFLSMLLDASPREQVVFVSDDLRCPNPPQRNKACTLQQFWTLHERRRLKLNALYRIKKET